LRNVELVYDAAKDMSEKWGVTISGLCSMMLSKRVAFKAKAPHPKLFVFWPHPWGHVKQPMYSQAKKHPLGHDYVRETITVGPTDRFLMMP